MNRSRPISALVLPCLLVPALPAPYSPGNPAVQPVQILPAPDQHVGQDARDDRLVQRPGSGAQEVDNSEDEQGDVFGDDEDQDQAAQVGSLQTIAEREERNQPRPEDQLGAAQENPAQRIHRGAPNPPRSRSVSRLTSITGLSLPRSEP